MRSLTRPISLRPSDVGRLVAVQRVDVEPVVQVADQRPGRAGGVLDRRLGARRQLGRRRPSSRPSPRCPAPPCGWLFGRQIMSPREMSISSSSRSVTDIGGNASSHRPVEGVDRGDPVVRPDGRSDDLVAGLEHAAGDLAGVAAVVVAGAVGGPCGRITYCTGKRTSTRLRSEAMCTCSRWCSSDGAVVPGHVLGPRSTTLSPLQRRDRDERQVGHVELGGERGELVADLARRRSSR